MKDLWKKENANHPLYKMVYDALLWYKVINDGWRIRINNIIQVGYQYAQISVSIWEPKKINPTICWNLHTDTFRKMIDFQKSDFYYL